MSLLSGLECYLGRRSPSTEMDKLVNDIRILYQIEPTVYWKIRPNESYLQTLWSPKFVFY